MARAREAKLPGPPRAVGSRKAGPGRRPEGPRAAGERAEPSISQLWDEISDDAAARRAARARTLYQELLELDAERKAAGEADRRRPRRPATAERQGRPSGCSGRKSAPRKSPRSSARGPASPSPGCSKTERDKLLVLEERLHQRVVGQDEAVDAVANAVRRSRSGPAGPEPPDRLVPLPRPHRRRQDRAVQGPGRGAVRRREGHGPHRHERVHGEAHRRPPDRRPAGLRRLRRRRPADRSRPPPAVLASCCSTKSRRPTATCSTSCCKCSTTAG